MRIIQADDSGGPTNNAHSFIRGGLMSAFAGCRHDAIMWDIHKKPSLEMLREQPCDLLIAQTYNLDRGLCLAIEENPNMKVILTASDWSENSDSVDITQFPILRANKQEIKWVERLAKQNRISFVFCHYHQNSMRKTHQYWEDKLNLKLVGLPPAADITRYCNSTYDESFRSDITHISGYWPYKARIIDKWLFPLCDSSLGLNIKIFGNRNWPVKYCGSLDERYTKTAFKSTKLNINLSEPHSHEIFGNHEINEKCFKILAGKNQLLSDYTESLAKDFFFSGEVEYAKTPQEFKEKALAIINGDLQTDIRAGYDTVMTFHTYFSRIESIFTHLNMPEQAKNVRITYQKIRKENNL
jgi:hypothetical protein